MSQPNSAEKDGQDGSEDNWGKEDSTGVVDDGSGRQANLGIIASIIDNYELLQKVALIRNKLQLEQSLNDKK